MGNMPTSRVRKPIGPEFGLGISQGDFLGAFCVSCNASVGGNRNNNDNMELTTFTIRASLTVSFVVKPAGNASIAITAATPAYEENASILMTSPSTTVARPVRLASHIIIPITLRMSMVHTRAELHTFANDHLVHHAYANHVSQRNRHHMSALMNALLNQSTFLRMMMNQMMVRHRRIQRILV